MKARDELRSSTLRMVLTAITNAEVAGKEARELTDDDVTGVLASEAKKRREAATAFDDAGRAELAAKERAEAAIIAEFLPEPLSAEQISELVAADDRRARRRRRRHEGDGPGDGCDHAADQGPCRRWRRVGRGPQAARLGSGRAARAGSTVTSASGAAAVAVAAAVAAVAAPLPPPFRRRCRHRLPPRLAAGGSGWPLET